MTALRVAAVTVVWLSLRSDGILHRVLDLLKCLNSLKLVWRKISHKNTVPQQNYSTCLCSSNFFKHL